MKVRLKSREDSSPFTLLFEKEYEVAKVEKGWYRIIDEDVDDYIEPKGYLYPPEMFEIVKE